MKNETLIKAAKAILKDLLSRCTDEECHVFRKMYCNKWRSKQEMTPIDEVVDNMDPNKMDWAISQCEATINNHKDR